MSRPSVSNLLAAFSRRPLVFIAAALALVIVVAGGAYVLWNKVTAGPTQTIYARFASTPGVYVGNRVAILGIPKGEITKITAHGTYVEVRMSLPASLKIPADAKRRSLRRIRSAIALSSSSRRTPPDR